MVSFIFADLIILPIILIYRKYYGTKVALRITATFYAAMVATSYVVEVVFGVAHLVPSTRHARITEAAVTWNYTTFLNLAFLVLAGALVARFFTTGGRPMLKMMAGSPGGEHDRE